MFLVLTTILNSSQLNKLALLSSIELTKVEISTEYGCVIPRYFDRHTHPCDAEDKPHMMAYDKQLKDFATMYDEEAIL
jgi:hypothetical protein